MAKSAREIQNIGHDMLQTWADWKMRYEDTSCIGYPSSTADGRLAKEGGVLPNTGKPKSRVPNCIMPKRVTLVDRVYPGMPDFMKTAVRVCFFETKLKTDKQRAYVYSIAQKDSERSYRTALEAARIYIFTMRHILRGDNEHRE